MSDKWEVVTKSKKTRAAAVVELVATNGGNNGAKKKNTLKMEDIRTCVPKRGLIAHNCI